MNTKTASTAAVLYVTEAFAMDRADIKGRHSAGLGILSGIARHLASDPLYCYSAKRTGGHEFADLVEAAAGRSRPVKLIAYGDEARLAEPGCLFRPDPALGPLAWRRRAIGQRAYSICGLTHSLCSTAVMDSLGDVLLAPLQPWDALICTSTAARAAIEGVIERWGDYLEERLGARAAAALRLPVIPLGVDCERFADDGSADRRRAALRQELEIAEDDVVLLFFGRMSFHGKAHPVAMFRAAEAAAAKASARLRLLLCGQYPNDSVRRAFEEAAQAYAPSLTVRYVDGSDEVRSAAAWCAADVFVSLSDNIQETFGLTPIEAQAAGLPVVVSDWDGYKDTVLDGETGFRVPTLIPWPGPGERLMNLHASEAMSYDRYIGGASLMTVVDIERAAEVMVRLADDPSLRRQMGEAGRRHARTSYDWSVVIARYGALWAELAEVRATATELAPRRAGRPAAPLRDDPFRVFAGFATATLRPEQRVEVTALAEELSAILGHAVNNYLRGFLLPRENLEALLRAAADGASVGELVRALSNAAPDRVTASLLWLAKVGVVRLPPWEGDG